MIFFLALLQRFLPFFVPFRIPPLSFPLLLFLKLAFFYKKIKGWYVTDEAKKRSSQYRPMHIASLLRERATQLGWWEKNRKKKKEKKRKGKKNKKTKQKRRWLAFVKFQLPQLVFLPFPFGLFYALMFSHFLFSYILCVQSTYP